MAKYPKVDELTLADMNTAGAERLAAKLGQKNVVVHKVDGTNPDELRSLLKGKDIVVATMPWRLNKLALDISISLGVNYVDYGMPFDSTGPEFDDYSGRCKDAGITAMMGMGEEPGISDVLAVSGARRFERVDEAHIFDGDTASVEGLDFFSSWSPVDLLDETSVPAAILRDGEIEFIPPLSRRTEYEFPEPLGKLPVYSTNHDETYFMPTVIKGLKQASFNIGIDDGFAEAAKLFRKWGLLGKEPVSVRGKEVVPQHVVAALLPRPEEFAGRMKGDTCFVVELTGEMDGRTVKLKQWTMMSHDKAYEICGTNAGAYLVGTGGAVATEMLIDGIVRERGIVIPEQLPPDDYLGRLAAKGVTIQEETVPL